MTDRECQLIAVASGKGGVGKTLLAACIESLLREQSLVLLIDMDLSVKGLTFMYGNAESWQQEPGGMIEFFEDEVSANDIIKKAISREKIHIIPASTNFKRDVDWDKVLGDAERSEQKLLELVQEAVHKYEVETIIFDTRAGIDGLFMALAALNPTTLVVVEPDEISLTSALDLRGQLKDEIKRLYFVVNKSPEPYTTWKGTILELINFLPPLPFDINLYRRFVRNARDLMKSGFRETRYRRYVGRLIKSLYPEKKVPVPSFFDYLMGKRTTKFVLNLTLYGLLFMIIFYLITFLSLLLIGYPL